MNAVTRSLTASMGLAMAELALAAPAPATTPATGDDMRPPIFSSPSAVPTEPMPPVEHTSTPVSAQTRLRITSAALTDVDSNPIAQPTFTPLPDAEERPDVVQLERYFVRAVPDRPVTLPLRKNVFTEALLTGQLFRHVGPVFTSEVAVIPGQVWHTGVSRVELAFNLRW